MSKRQRYAPHAVHLSPHELSRKLAAHWCMAGKLAEWWRPDSIPAFAREIVRECFKFDPDDITDREYYFVHLAIVNSQPRPARPYATESEVVEAACLALLDVAEQSGWAVSLCNGANGVLTGNGS